MPDDLDELLARTLRDRRIPSAPHNLADLAVSRARNEEARHHRLRILAGRARLISIAAVMLIGATIAFACLQWPSASTGTYQVSASAAETFSDFPEWQSIAGASIFLLAAVALWGAISFRDDATPLTPLA